MAEKKAKSSNALLNSSGYNEADESNNQGEINWSRMNENDRKTAGEITKEGGEKDLNNSQVFLS